MSIRTGPVAGHASATTEAGSREASFAIDKLETSRVLFDGPQAQEGLEEWNVSPSKKNIPEKNTKAGSAEV